MTKDRFDEHRQEHENEGHKHSWSYASDTSPEQCVCGAEKAYATGDVRVIDYPEGLWPWGKRCKVPGELDLIKVSAVALKETKHHNISEEHKPYIKDIYSVYAFDPESYTYCCEITPSYDLRYICTFVECTDDTSEERRGGLDEEYCHGEQEPTLYMHVSAVKALKTKVQCEYKTIEAAVEYLQCNWNF